MRRNPLIPTGFGLRATSSWSTFRIDMLAFSIEVANSDVASSIDSNSSTGVFIRSVIAGAVSVSQQDTTSGLHRQHRSPDQGSVAMSRNRDSGLSIIGRQARIQPRILYKQ